MRKFKTESKKLLDLMIHSIYTNKEIFLRELISNASDALDKLHYKSLTSGGDVDRSALGIDVSFDAKARTITVSDNGIGMDKDALEKNLGTIAHSGSLDFKNDTAEDEKADEVDIIGQFGVGFYSAFMIADEVEVITRAYGDEQAWSWKSDGLEGYNITEATRDACGTDVIMHVRPNTDEEEYDAFLDSHRLQQLIKRYSDYVRYPVRMELDHTRELPKPDDAGDDYEPQYERYTEVETINSMIPIWTRSKSDVEQSEYDDFYMSQFHATEGPLRTIQMRAEGTLSYDALLFLPTHAPYDLYSKDFEKGLKLYSNNVMIMEKCSDLLPDCFNFVRGVVDCADLNLNISRETLQQSRQVQAIERKIEKKVKTELAKMRDDDREAYEKFFGEFGHAFKYAIYSSYGMQKDLLSDLLLFYSAKEKKPVTLAEYIAATTEDQNSIFYAFGDTVVNLAQSPAVKSVVEKGYDVLLCADSVDEFCLMSIGTFGEKDMRNVAGGDLGIESEEEAEEAAKANEDNADLFADMAASLGEHVSRVVASSRLTDEPACIIADGPVSLGMEKYFQSLPEGDEQRQKAKHILEINTEHPIFAALTKAYADDDTAKVARYAKILHDQSMLAEGMTLDNIAEYNKAVWELMA